MTTSTRNGLIGLLDSPAVAEIDQAVMDAYLSAYSSREDYERNARNQTCFIAVLATAEYHEHWERIGSASTVTETPTGDTAHEVFTHLDPLADTVAVFGCDCSQCRAALAVLKGW